MSKLLKRLVLAGLSLLMVLGSFLSILVPSVSVSAATGERITDLPPLTYEDFRGVGIPDSTFYVPASKDVLDSSVSNNCLRPESQGDSKGKLGNLVYGDTTPYGSGRDTSQSAYFCFFRTDKSADCEADSFINKFNNPKYKKATDIIPSDPDVQACIQFVRAGDRCIVDNAKIGSVDGKQNPLTIRTDTGKTKLVNVAYLSSETFGGAISTAFYCDLQANSDTIIKAQGGIIRDIDTRCQGNPYLVVSGVQACLRGQYLLDGYGTPKNTISGTTGQGTFGSAIIANRVDKQCVQNPNVQVDGLPVCQNGIYTADLMGLQDVAIQQALAPAKTLVAKDGQNATLTGWGQIKDCGFGNVMCVAREFVDGIGTFLIKGVLGIIALIIGVVVLALKLVVYLEASVINTILLINPASDQFIGISQSVVKIVQSLAYLMILITVAGLGLNYIIGNKSGRSDISGVILNIAVLAIGIQFSFFAVAAAIALSYQIGYVFSSGIISAAPALANNTVINAQNIFTGFTDAILISFNIPVNILDNVRNIFSGGWDNNLNSAFSVFIELLIGAVVLGFTAVAFWKLLMTLGTRLVVLFLLLISSPIGFVMYVSQYPAFKKAGDSWFRTFTTYVLSFPIVVIMLSFGIIIILKFNSAMDSYYVGFVNNKTTNASGADSGITPELINTYIPIFLKMAITLGFLQFFTNYIDKSLMPFTSQAISGFNKAVGGTNSFFRKSQARFKSAQQLVGKFGRGAAATTGVAVGGARGMGRILSNISAGGNALLSGKSAKVALRNAVGRNDAGTGTRDGRTLLSETIAGYKVGKDFNTTNPASQAYQAQVLAGRKEIGAGLRQGAAETAVRLRRLAQNADGTDNELLTSLADTYSRKNGIKNNQFDGYGGANMKNVTTEEQKRFVEREAASARALVVRPADAGKRATTAYANLIETRYSEMLEEARRTAGVANVSDLSEDARNEVARKLVFDGGGRANVKDALDELGEKFGASERDAVRKSGKLSELFGSAGYQQEYLNQGPGGVDVLKKQFSGDNLAGLLNDGLIENEVIENIRTGAIRKAIEKPEEVDRRNFDDPGFLRDVEKTMESKYRGLNPNLISEKWSKMGLQGRSAMPEGSISKIFSEIENSGMTLEQQTTAKKSIRATLASDFRSTRDLLDIEDAQASGMKREDVQKMQRARYEGISDKLAVESAKMIKGHTGTNVELATKLQQQFQNSGEFTGAIPQLDESHVKELRDNFSSLSQTDLARSQARSAMRELAGSTGRINMSVAAEQAPIRDELKNMVLEQVKAGKDVDIAGQQFSKADAVTQLRDAIATSTRNLDPAKKEAKQRELFAQYFGKDTSRAATDSELKEKIADGGFKKYMGGKFDPINKSQDLSKSMYEGILAAPFAAAFTPALREQIAQTITEDNRFNEQTISRNMDNGKPQEKNNQMTREMLEELRRQNAGSAGGPNPVVATSVFTPGLVDIAEEFSIKVPTKVVQDKSKADVQSLRQQGKFGKLNARDISKIAPAAININQAIVEPTPAPPSQPAAPRALNPKIDQISAALGARAIGAASQSPAPIFSGNSTPFIPQNIPDSANIVTRQNAAIPAANASNANNATVTPIVSSQFTAPQVADTFKSTTQPQFSTPQNTYTSPESTPLIPKNNTDNSQPQEYQNAGAAFVEQSQAIQTPAPTADQVSTRAEQIVQARQQPQSSTPEPTQYAGSDTTSPTTPTTQTNTTSPTPPAQNIYNTYTTPVQPTQTTNVIPAAPQVQQTAGTTTLDAAGIAAIGQAVASANEASNTRFASLSENMQKSLRGVNSSIDAGNTLARNEFEAKRRALNNNYGVKPIGTQQNITNVTNQTTATNSTTNQNIVSQDKSEKPRFIETPITPNINIDTPTSETPTLPTPPNPNPQK